MALNGRIDVTTLTPVRGSPGAYLRSDVEASWFALCDEVEATYGWRPTLTGPFDAYRPWAVQERIFRQRYTTAYVTGIDPRGWDSDRNGVPETWWRLPIWAAAAVPGTSNHGLATTVDVANLRYGTERFRQFAAIAIKHGWSNAEGRSVNEAWHWTKVTAGAAPTPTPLEEDFMAALTDDEQRRMLGHADAGSAVLDQVRNLLLEIRPEVKRLPHIQAQTDTIAAATTNITNGVVQLIGRAPTGDAAAVAAAIADALDDDLAAAVVDLLARRLTA